MSSELSGNKSQDVITSSEFIKPINEIVADNNNDNKVTFSDFSLGLRGFANSRLENCIKLLKIKIDPRTWTVFKPFFKA